MTLALIKFLIWFLWWIGIPVSAAAIFLFQLPIPWLKHPVCPGGPSRRLEFTVGGLTALITCGIMIPYLIVCRFLWSLS